MKLLFRRLTSIFSKSSFPKSTGWRFVYSFAVLAFSAVTALLLALTLRLLQEEHREFLFNRAKQGAKDHVVDGLVEPSWAASVVVERAGAFCSGVVVSETQVLTAAHCVGKTAEAGRVMKVSFGRTHPKRFLREKIKVIKASVHPGYLGWEDYGEYDLAVLTLEKPVPRSWRPARISWQAEDRFGPLFLSGFGRKPGAFLGTYALTPIHGYLVYPDGVINSLSFVDGVPCQGDSGGGVFSHDKTGRPVLVGIMSSVLESLGDRKCLFGQYSVNLAAHKNWIFSQISPLGTITASSE